MAARRNGWRTASDIDCDCRRSNAAAIGRANASVGSTRCQATSTIDVVQDASTVPADSIPPVGSHRVRAAMNTSISDMRSGGTEMHMTDVPRHERGEPSGTAGAREDAEPNPDKRRHDQRGYCEHRRIARRPDDKRADGAVVEKGVSEVEADGA
jgi:hypothetical protein